MQPSQAVSNCCNQVQQAQAKHGKSIVFFGQPRFIQCQRITGAALMAFSALASVIFPWMAIGIAVGSALIGLSLIQQVVAKSPDCKRGKAARVAAGVFITLGGPLGWIIGGICWHVSNRKNRHHISA